MNGVVRSGSCGIRNRDPGEEKTAKIHQVDDQQEDERKHQGVFDERLTLFAFSAFQVSLLPPVVLCFL